MFKNYKEICELKKTKLQLEVLILNKFYDLTKVIDGASDILEMAQSLKGASEKDIVDAIVNKIKSSEDTKVDGE